MTLITIVILMTLEASFTIVMFIGQATGVSEPKGCFMLCFNLSNTVHFFWVKFQGGYFQDFSEPLLVAFWHLSLS